METLADHLGTGGADAHALTLGEVDRLGAVCHGLPIVASLTRASQGTLELRARSPHGLHAVLRLQAADPGPEPAEPPAASSPRPATLLRA